MFTTVITTTSLQKRNSIKSKKCLTSRKVNIIEFYNLEIDVKETAFTCAGVECRTSLGEVQMLKIYFIDAVRSVVKV